MIVRDLKKPDGLIKLNAFLADRSYIEGHFIHLFLTHSHFDTMLSRYSPSQADLLVFEAIGKAPVLVHVQRWYRHIASFSIEERSQWKANYTTDDDGHDDIVFSDSGSEVSEAEFLHRSVYL